MLTLKIQPQLRAGSEEMRKAQRGVSSDRALAVQDLSDAIRGDPDPARKFRGAHVQGSQFFGQALARTNHDGVAAMAGPSSGTSVTAIG